MRLDIEIGLYSEDFTRMKKWFYAAFAEKEPTAQDKILFKKVEVFEQDMLRQDKEDADVD